MELFCPKCKDMVSFSIDRIQETYKIKGQMISIDSRVSVCNSCHEKLFNEEIDEDNINLAYNEYRKRNNILTPNEIKEIREKYSLTQRALGRLLKWGEVTINRYENGAIPDEAHNEVLELIKHPSNLKEIFNRNQEYLREKEKEELNIILEQFEEEEYSSCDQFLREFLLSKHQINEFSGFSDYDLDKLQNIILFICKKLEGVFKSKINKLLFYIDFLYFRNYSVSISGCVYKHDHYGPVPKYYEIILANMVDKEWLKLVEVPFGEDMVGSKYFSNYDFEERLFKTNEIAVIEYVSNELGKLNCKEIENLSHKEEAYLRTQLKKEISYKFADKLTIDIH